MPSISNYPSGFTNGVTIRGLPIQSAQPGKQIWVNNSGVVPDGGVAGADGNSLTGGGGKGTYTQPYASIAYALSVAVAGRGDIIMVGPGHAETISSATAYAWATSGVLIFGLGSGDLMPTLTFGTATTSTITVSAANMGIYNFKIVANFAAVASAFTLTTAKNFTISNCMIQDTSSILNFATLVTTDTTSHHADNLWLENNNWYGLGATANTTAISMTGTNDRLTLKNNYITHAATTVAGLMIIATGKVVTNAIITDNVANLVGNSTASNAVLISTNGSTNSGILARNYAQSLCDTTPVLVTASSGFKFYNNYYSSTANTSGFLLPAVGS